MTEKSFTIRRFTLSDVDEVVKLLSTVFKTRFTSQWWNWKYKCNPAGFYGGQGDIWVAESVDGIVGYYAVIPVKMKFGSETITVAQSVDTATHPDYRGLRIFPTLAKKVYSEAHNRYRFLYGFPSKMAYKGFLRLGWKDIRINVLLEFLNYDRPLRNFLDNTLLIWLGKIFLRPIPIARSIASKVFTRKYQGTSVEIEKMDRFPNDIDSFWESLRSEYEIVIERRADFLNWRFSKHFGNYQLYIARSIKEREIIGYMVLRKKEMRGIDSLHIVDLQTLPDEERSFLSLMNTAFKVAGEEEMDLICCWIPQWHKNAKILSRLGFISLNWVPKRVSHVNSNAIFYTYGQKNLISKAKHRWFYTLADTDYA